MDSLAFEGFAIIIIAVLWVFRIKYLLVAAGGKECDGRIVGFNIKKWWFRQHSGWGHMCSYSVLICHEEKSILSESADEIFVPENTKPDGLNSEISVIYNPRSDKCIMSSFLKEAFYTFILLAVSVFFTIAFIHDLQLVLGH